MGILDEFYLPHVTNYGRGERIVDGRSVEEARRGRSLADPSLVRTPVRSTAGAGRFFAPGFGGFEDEHLTFYGPPPAAATPLQEIDGPPADIDGGDDEDFGYDPNSAGTTSNFSDFAAGLGTIAGFTSPFGMAGLAYDIATNSPPGSLSKDLMGALGLDLSGDGIGGMGNAGDMGLGAGGFDEAGFGPGDAVSDTGGLDGDGTGSGDAAGDGDSGFGGGLGDGGLGDAGFGAGDGVGDAGGLGGDDEGGISGGAGSSGGAGQGDEGGISGGAGGSAGGGEGGDGLGDADGGGGDGGGSGCVVATEMMRQEIWSAEDRQRVVRWCVRALHGTRRGNLARRGYRFYGRKLVKLMKRWPPAARACSWMFQSFSDHTTGRRPNIAGRIIYHSFFWPSVLIGLFARKS